MAPNLDASDSTEKNSNNGRSELSEEVDINSSREPNDLEHFKESVVITFILFISGILLLVTAIFMSGIPWISGAALLALSFLSGTLGLVRFGLVKFSEASLVKTDEENNEE